MNTPLRRTGDEDRRLEDERGTVKPNGTIKDRRTVQPWVRGLVGILLVAFVVALIVGGIAALIALHNVNSTDKAQSAAKTAKQKSDKAVSKSNRAVDVASSTDKRLDRNERRDRDDLRAAAYRICIRGKVDRAFAHSRIAHALHGRRRELALRDLERLDGLPILDCQPNLRGHGARPLPPAKQRAYMRAWEQHKLTEAQLGICPASRVPGRIRSPERC